MKIKSEYGASLLRLTIGVMFIYTGIVKLMNPAGPTGMLTNLGFPIPTVFAWVLLLSEIVFGILVLVGWKVKYTVWPLVLILVVALALVTIPNANGNYINIIFHLVTIAGLISLYLTGPGELALGKN